MPFNSYYVTENHGVGGSIPPLGTSQLSMMNALEGPRRGIANRRQSPGEVGYSLRKPRPCGRKTPIRAFLGRSSRSQQKGSRQSRHKRSSGVFAADGQ